MQYDVFKKFVTVTVFCRAYATVSEIIIQESYRVHGDNVQAHLSHLYKFRRTDRCRIRIVLCRYGRRWSIVHSYTGKCSRARIKLIFSDLVLCNNNIFVSIDLLIIFYDPILYMCTIWVYIYILLNLVGYKGLTEVLRIMQGVWNVAGSIARVCRS